MSQVKVILTVMKYVNKQLQIKPRIFLLVVSEFFSHWSLRIFSAGFISNCLLSYFITTRITFTCILLSPVHSYDLYHIHMTVTQEASCLLFFLQSFCFLFFPFHFLWHCLPCTFQYLVFFCQLHLQLLLVSLGSILMLRNQHFIVCRSCFEGLTCLLMFH